jgi:hypothetical protein
LASKQTTVTIHEASWNDIRPNNYLFLSLAVGDELGTSYGSILMGSEYRHKIFVKGIYVKSKPVGKQALFYGVNFQSSTCIETGRDRNALVSNDALAAEAMYEIWAELIASHNEDATGRYLQLLCEHEESFDVLDARELVQKPIADELVKQAKKDMGPNAFLYCPAESDSGVHFPLSQFSDAGRLHYRKCAPTKA